MSGPIKLSTGPSGGNAEFLPLSFPKTKEDIETFIVRGFLTTVSRQDILPSALESLARNELDDFDFTVMTHNGPKYIELMEIAPLEHLGESYNKAHSSYKPYDFARYIMDKILGKSDRYISPTDIGLVLLLYVTDWHFKLNETTLRLLKYWTLDTRHCFEGIYYYSPAFKDTGVAEVIFPTAKDKWIGFNSETYRDVEAFPVDPRGWQIEIK